MKERTIMTLEELTNHLTELRLFGMQANFADIGRIAEKERKTYEQYLGIMAKVEVDVRNSQKVKKLIKEAKLPLQKSVKKFDYSSRTGITEKEVLRLAEGKCIQDGGNIVFFGEIGVGKTHLALGLIREWCERKFRCFFTSTNALIESLLEAKKGLCQGNLWKRLDRYDVVVCDELGYLPQTKDGADLFFQFISQRYERKSIVITTNLTYSEWDKVFLNSVTTSAAVDRIIHNCETFNIQGPSWRQEEAKKKKLQ